jgi:predicted DNA-binding WGR domain protein
MDAGRVRRSRPIEPGSVERLPEVLVVMASKRRFECVEGGSNKFWEVAVDGERVTTCFGRVGTAGSTKEKTFASPAEAEREAAKVVAEKTRKGYVEVGGGREPAKPAGASATKAPKAASTRAGAPAPSSMGELLAALRATLDAKYPRYAASLGKPVAADARERALGPVPEELAALWSFADGAEGLFATSDDDAGMDFLSVSDAESERAELVDLGVGLPEGAIPFATDGAGNFWCCDPKGALFDWDHETRKATPLQKTLAAMVKATAAAAKSGAFRGGPEVVAKPNAALQKAMKLIEADPKENAYKIETTAEKLEPAQAVELMRALVRAAPDHAEAYDALAKQEARAGLWAEAIASAEKGRFRNTSTLHWVGEAALDAGRFAEAEQAFAAIETPSVLTHLAVAVAQQKQGKGATDAIGRAEAMNEKLGEEPVDWKSATSCYARARVVIERAAIQALRGDVAGARSALAEATPTFEQIASKGVRAACLDQLRAPARSASFGAVVYEHCGL